MASIIYEKNCAVKYNGLTFCLFLDILVWYFYEYIYKKDIPFFAYFHDVPKAYARAFFSVTWEGHHVCQSCL